MSDPEATEEAIVRASRDTEWNTPIRSVNRRNLNDGYPGTVTTPKTGTNWRGDGTCTFCEHKRDEHGDKSCGVHLIASQFCRCPYGSGLPACPNELDPVMCKVHGGVFIPEAGCPRHDREVAS